LSLVERGLMKPTIFLFLLFCFNVLGGEYVVAFNNGGQVEAYFEVRFGESEIYESVTLQPSENYGPKTNFWFNSPEYLTFRVMSSEIEGGIWEESYNEVDGNFFSVTKEPSPDTVSMQVMPIEGASLLMVTLEGFSFGSVICLTALLVKVVRNIRLANRGADILSGD